MTPGEELVTLVASLNESVENNAREVQKATKELKDSHRILARKRIWIIGTCISVLIDLALTGVLLFQGFALRDNQHKINNIARNGSTTAQQVRVNACNLNLLLRQSVVSSGNTVDLYSGLRPLFVGKTDPVSLAALHFIDKATASIKTTAVVRQQFLELVKQTTNNLHCPNTFIVK